MKMSKFRYMSGHIAAFTLRRDTFALVCFIRSRCPWITTAGIQEKTLTHDSLRNREKDRALSAVANNWNGNSAWPRIYRARAECFLPREIGPRFAGKSPITARRINPAYVAFNDLLVAAL